MTHWDARTRQMGTIPVNRENISPARNAALPEGSGPLGVAPTCIVRLRAIDTLLRYACSPCAEHLFCTKSGFPRILSLPVRIFSSG